MLDFFKMRIEAYFKTLFYSSLIKRRFSKLKTRLFLQIRIEGKVEKLPLTEADTYWTHRPASSQASAAISKQSTIVKSREFLEQEVAKIHQEYIKENKPIPRPANW